MSGVVLVVVGALFLASNLGALPDINFARMWPLVFVLIGVGKMMSPDEGESRWSGTVFLLMAGIFLAHNYDVLKLRDSWPLFIVVAGLSVLFGAMSCRKERNVS
jgi:hypothetical protein